MLSPADRLYDPVRKLWTVDLLELPNLLGILALLGFQPCIRLKSVASNCNSLLSHLDPATVVENAFNNDLVKAEVQEGMPSSALQSGLSEAMKQFMELLIEQAKEARDENTANVDRADCGESKRQRLTLAQEVWSYKQKNEFCEDDYDTLAIRILSSRRKSTDRYCVSTKKTLVDCDCGNPDKRSAGVNTCVDTLEHLNANAGMFGRVLIRGEVKCRRAEVAIGKVTQLERNP